MASNDAPSLHLFQQALKGKSVSMIQRIEWVSQNRLRPWQAIGPDEPPDMAAFDMLIQAKKDEKWFFEKLVPALVPTKKELEVQAAKADDGRALRLLDAFQEGFDAAQSPQGHRSEHAVSPGNLQVGDGEPVGTGGDSTSSRS